MKLHQLLIWFSSSPVDAIMTTPILRVSGLKLPDTFITLLASGCTRLRLLSDPFCDEWLNLKEGDLRQIKSGQFNDIFLLENLLISTRATARKLLTTHSSIGQENEI